MICEVADTHGSVAKDRVLSGNSHGVELHFKWMQKEEKNYGKNCVKNQISFLRSQTN